MINIILTPDEVAICQILGRMRSLIARSSNVKDAKIGKQDGSDADVLGVMAEYAFAKHFNVFPDLGLSPRSGSADGIYKGWRYDIKSTTYENGRLLCTTKDNPDVDMYILGIVKGNAVNFPGWALKSELRQECNKIDLGHGTHYGLDQDRLRRFNVI
jgi:hypothetical protein